MKRYIVKTYWRASQYGPNGESMPMQEGKTIIIEARNRDSAERKAEKLWTAYRHFEVIGEAKED